MQLRPYTLPSRKSHAVRSVTVEPGTVNRNDQMVVRRAGRDADGMPGQHVYVLRCQRSGCGEEYGEEGIRVHGRKCPRCQGGKAGLPVPDATLFG